ncbi:antitermination protein [Escherichia coli]|nr:antitermination protein [Escherichia coli]
MTSAITLDTWKQSVKCFYDTLVIRFDIEEAWAEQQLKRVTR